MKNSNVTIVNQTRDLPVCIAVPQPTVPPRDTLYKSSLYIWAGGVEVWWIAVRVERFLTLFQAAGTGL
jgi:hypothetical protein